MHSSITFRAVIVDDEHLARQIVRDYLSRHPQIEIVAECSNGFEAVKAIDELKPDLLFLDIQMPKLNGFEVLELIGSDIPVIFTTAYDEFAVRAFEVNAVDYLLKPFSQERFDRALERVLALPRPAMQARLGRLKSHAQHVSAPLERIVVRDGGKVHVVRVEAIDYMEAQDDYVAIVTEGKKLLKQTRLAVLEESLDPKRFVRIHRSYLLNLERLSKIEPYGKDSHIAVLNNGTRLPISKSGFAKLKELL
ncbi:MAG TPA: response regulator [Bacteroidota bacterium]|nr:response regulator [Bacteroidota bacterium]